MTPAEIEKLKKQLWIGAQSYVLETGDNLDKLADIFGYISRAVLIDANKALIERRGEARNLQVGDTIDLPRFTSLNHAKTTQAARKKQAEEEIKIAESPKQGTPFLFPATIFTTPVNTTSWNSVRIYWANSKPDDLSKTYPFPQIHAISGSAKDERTTGVANLNQKVHINQFETFHNNKAQKDQSQIEKSWDQAKFEAKDFNEAYQTSIAVQNETLYVPQANIDDFGDYLKFSHNDKSKKRGDDVLLTKKRVGRIASAVSQWVIAEVELEEALGPTDKLPNLTTWAFLQPPAIGNNKFRKAAQNEWVVDDAQKSGWFLGEIRGDNATPLSLSTNRYSAKMDIKRECYTVDDDNKEVKHTLEYTQDVIIEVGNDGKKVKYKYEVIVYNDSSKEDFKKKRDSLLDGEKYADVLSIECGSYMKIWVRNADFPWSDFGPIDEYSEDLRLGMDREDPHINPRILKGEVNPDYNPQLAPNHSWRRERLVDASSAEEGNTKTYGDLLYVGLYPTSIIHSLNKVEDFAQPLQPGQPRTLNLPTWAAVTFLYGGFLFLARSIISRLAEKQVEKMKKASEAKKKKYLEKVNEGLEGYDVFTYGIKLGDLTNAEYWRHAYAVKAETLLNNLEVPETFALLAVGGFEHGFDLEKTLNDLMDESGNAPIQNRANNAYKAVKKGAKNEAENAVNIVRMLETTTSIYTHFIRFGVFDLTNKFTKKSHKKELKDKADGAKKRLIERRTKGLLWRTLARGEVVKKDNFIKALRQLVQPDIESDAEQTLIKLATDDIALVSYNDTKIMPSPMGKPLPGYLAIIFWSFMVRIKGDLTLNLATEFFRNKSTQYLNDHYEATDKAKASISPNDELLKILVGLGGKGASFEAIFSLQAAWTAAVRAYDTKASSGHEKGVTQALNDFAWGPALKDIFEYTEVSFDIGAKFSLDAELKWALTYFFGRDGSIGDRLTSQLHDFFSTLKLEAPMSCRLAIFSWQYQLASMDVADVRTKEATLFSRARMFNFDFPNLRTVINWGDHKIAGFVFRDCMTSRHVYFGDRIGIMLGYANLGTEVKMTARIGTENAILFTDDSDAANSETKDSLIELDVFNYSHDLNGFLQYKDQKYKSTVSEDFSDADVEAVGNTCFQITLDLEAEKQFRLPCLPDKQVISLSQHGISIMSLLNQLDGQSEIELAAEIKPGRQYPKRPLNKGDIVLRLPVITSKQVATTASGIRFTFGIQNFKRQYEFAWLQIRDVDSFSKNDVIQFKARPDQPEGFMTWNLVKLTRQEAPHTDETKEPFGHYYFDCPKALIDTNTVVDATDFYSDELEISGALAYFASVKNTFYMDGGAKKVVQPNGNTYMIKESISGSTSSKIPLSNLK